MLETFLELVMASNNIGKITSFYGRADLMTIDGFQKDGVQFHLSYRTDGSDLDADT